MAAFYFQVYNTATREQVAFQKMHFESLEEARLFRDRLRAEYGNVGCHKVKMFLEIYPDQNEDEDMEEEFDADELEEEE